MDRERDFCFVLFAKLSQFYQELRMCLLCSSESSSEMTYSSRYSSLSLGVQHTISFPRGPMSQILSVQSRVMG